MFILPIAFMPLQYFSFFEWNDYILMINWFVCLCYLDVELKRHFDVRPWKVEFSEKHYSSLSFCHFDTSSSIYILYIKRYPMMVIDRQILKEQPDWLISWLCKRTNTYTKVSVYYIMLCHANRTHLWNQPIAFFHGHRFLVFNRFIITDILLIRKWTISIIKCKRSFDMPKFHRNSSRS